MEIIMIPFRADDTDQSNEADPVRLTIVESIESIPTAMYTKRACLILPAQDG